MIIMIIILFIPFFLFHIWFTRSKMKKNIEKCFKKHAYIYLYSRMPLCKPMNLIPIAILSFKILNKNILFSTAQLRFHLFFFLRENLVGKK